MWLARNVLLQPMPIGPRAGYNGLMPTYPPPPNLPRGQPRRIALLYEVGHIRYGEPYGYHACRWHFFTCSRQRRLSVCYPATARMHLINFLLKVHRMDQIGTMGFGHYLHRATVEFHRSRFAITRWRSWGHASLGLGLWNSCGGRWLYSFPGSNVHLDIRRIILQVEPVERVG